MPADLDGDPLAAVGLCRSAHSRLLATAESLTEDDVRSPSRLPGWTIGHVLTHLARNADGHVRRLEGALRGDDVPRYPGGTQQRDAEISAGAGRPAAEIAADVRDTQARLVETWDRSQAAGWPNSDLRGADDWPSTSSPVRRLREVEIHHVDLGRGYDASDWPSDYVVWELPQLLATVPERVHLTDDARGLIVWLAGRGPIPSSVELDPW